MKTVFTSWKWICFTNLLTLGVSPSIIQAKREKKYKSSAFFQIKTKLQPRALKKEKINNYIHYPQSM